PLTRPPPTPTLFPYTTLFRSHPDHVPALAGLLVVGDLCLDPRHLRELIRAAAQNAWLEQADADLRLPRLRAVGHLRIEVGVDVADRKSTRLNSSHVSISYAVF